MELTINRVIEHYIKDKEEYLDKKCFIGKDLVFNVNNVIYSEEQVKKIIKNAVQQMKESNFPIKETMKDENHYLNLRLFVIDTANSKIQYITEFLQALFQWTLKEKDEEKKKYYNVLEDRFARDREVYGACTSLASDKEK